MLTDFKTAALAGRSLQQVLDLPAFLRTGDLVALPAATAFATRSDPASRDELVVTRSKYSLVVRR
jgi:hypothetical protein